MSNDIRTNRRTFLKSLAAAAALASGTAGQADSSATGRQASKKKTNFVFFLIDDLGWTDLGCYGSRYYETPNIDRLAEQGMKFTDAYAACCVCSPTRASILTGKYPGRLHITHAIPIQGALRHKKPLPLLPAIYTKNLPLEEVTIAEALKEAGYVSASMGKWHVCWDKGFYPEDQGFDVNVGGNNMGNPGNYFYPYKGAWRMTAKHPLVRWNTLPDGKPGEYLTDRLTDEAVKFIDKNRQRPFFLYLSHYAVHTPLQAPLHRLAEPRRVRGRCFAGFNPARPKDLALFQAVLDGDHLLRGLRNVDLRVRLFGLDPSDRIQRRGRSNAVSRLLKRLHAHRILVKVPHTRGWHLTPPGRRLLTAAVEAYHRHFPQALARLAA